MALGKKKNVVDLGDWDDLIKETYNKKYYSLQQQDGCMSRGFVKLRVPAEPEIYLDYDYEGDEDELTDYPDSIPFKVNGEEMGVSFKTWLETTEEDIAKEKPDWENFEHELFWERNFYPHLQILANDLHKKGLLEEGEYLIDINW